MYVYRDLQFEENANLNALEKIQTDRNYWGFPPQDVNENNSESHYLIVKNVPHDEQGKYI